MTIRLGGGGGGGGSYVPPVAPSFIGYIEGQNAAAVPLTGAAISAGAIKPGDLLIVAATSDHAAPTMSLGWTPVLPTQVTQFDGGTANMAFFWRVATSAEPASYTVSGSFVAAILACFRGAGIISALTGAH